MTRRTSSPCRRAVPADRAGRGACANWWNFKGGRTRMRALLTLRHGSQAWCSSSICLPICRGRQSISCILRSRSSRRSLNSVRGCARNRISTPLLTERCGDIVVVVSSDPYPILCRTIPVLGLHMPHIRIGRIKGRSHCLQ